MVGSWRAPKPWTSAPRLLAGPTGRPHGDRVPDRPCPGQVCGGNLSYSRALHDVVRGEVFVAGYGPMRSFVRTARIVSEHSSSVSGQLQVQGGRHSFHAILSHHILLCLSRYHSLTNAGWLIRKRPFFLPSEHTASAGATRFDSPCSALLIAPLVFPLLGPGIGLHSVRRAAPEKQRLLMQSAQLAAPAAAPDARARSSETGVRRRSARISPFSRKGRNAMS